MAKDNKKNTNNPEKSNDEQNNGFSNSILNDKAVKRNMSQLNNILSQSSLSLYGTDRVDDVESLNSKFQKILNGEVGTLTQNEEGDITSFINRLYSNDKKTTAGIQLAENQFTSITGEEYQAMQGLIYEAYRNRLLEQSDLHEVASQLIELSEAILITRDAIISADVVEGRMSRTLKINKVDDDDQKNTEPIIETVEKRFGLLEKLKNFVIPKTLEYGVYYVYTIPYSQIFNDFMKTKARDGYAQRMYKETSLYEAVTNSDPSHRKKEKVKFEKTEFIESIYTEYASYFESEEIKPDKKAFAEDMSNILQNISICNDSVPLPVMDEGFSSVAQYEQDYVIEGTTFTETKKTEAQKDEGKSFFNRIANGVTPDGITYTDDEKKKGKAASDFSDIKDCYIKLIDPTKIIPIKIMDQTLGYYFVQDEDITPLAGMISSTLYYNKFDEHSRQQSIVDSIAKRIVDCFDKDFLKDNIKFKKTIVEAINYYNLNEKRLKFQYIPVEYIQEFSIDQDENGNGQSMIKKSLFYAKLYLMILLFKIMSIILNSNDTKVNYIKTSGIDKNVANKVQEIARIKQSRQINMYDLFNYTTLINKVGNGNEMYVPVGRSGERPIETDILSGQDVALNSDLLEMLKNSYILGTGVPAAIVNYLNEADFAKVIEQNNTKFNGRVVNYQLDFNPAISEWYKKILRWSTNIPENIIENFEFILQPPKTVSSNAKAEAINGFNQLSEFIVGVFYGDPSQSTDETINDKIKKFKELFAEEQLPMLNFDKIRELVKEANLRVKEEKLKPDPKNGDDDDVGLADFGEE